MSITLPDLPFAKNALEPYISERTLEFHYGKHHQAYVNNGNSLIAGTELETLPLEEIIKKTSDIKEKVGIFNNAAQVWNHSFYWKCMKANGGNKAVGKIAAKIDTDFGSFEQFADEFKKAGATQFGSGWAWLVLDNDKLKIIKTANAGTPITQNLKPLLVVDVWEHAYYLDYQNRRPDYLTTFMDKLVNWDFVNSQLL
jgi:Fe-Mn family superoxide dismutase